jgi:hypothetical protein
MRYARRMVRGRGEACGGWTVSSPAIVSVKRSIRRIKKRIIWIPFFSSFDQLRAQHSTARLVMRGPKGHTCSEESPFFDTNLAVSSMMDRILRSEGIETWIPSFIGSRDYDALRRMTRRKKMKKKSLETMKNLKFDPSCCSCSLLDLLKCHDQIFESHAPFFQFL